MAKVPNKFNDPEQLGPFGLIRGPDEDGLYTYSWCMWLVGFVTYRSPYKHQTLKGAVDFREMNIDEVRQHLLDIETIYKDDWGMKQFVESARRRL